MFSFTKKKKIKTLIQNDGDETKHLPFEESEGQRKFQSALKNTH